MNHSFCEQITILVFNFFRTPGVRQDSLRKDSIHLPAENDFVAQQSVQLPSIIPELKDDEYEDDIVPSFMRVSISGEETSGVCWKCKYT